MSDIPPVQPNPGFSNYPRSGAPQPGGGFYQRPPGIYYDSISQAWRMIQANLGGWVVLTLCFFAVQYGVSIPLSFITNMLVYGNVLGANPGMYPGSAPPVSLDVSKIFLSMGLNSLGYLITLPLATGMQVTALRAVRGLAVGPGDLWCAFPRIGQVLLAWLVCGLLYIAGTLLCIVPVFYAMGVLAFVQLLVIDRNMSALQAIEESYRVLKSNAWSMFGLLFVAGLCTLLGMLACGVGMLFTFPISVLVPAIIYNGFFPPVDPNPQGYAISNEPPRSWG